MSWSPPDPSADDLADSVEKLRTGSIRMIARGQQNPADYGPINIWPHTFLALLSSRSETIPETKGQSRLDLSVSKRLAAALEYIVKHPNGVGDHHPSAVAQAALEGRPIPNV